MYTTTHHSVRKMHIAFVSKAILLTSCILLVGCTHMVRLEPHPMVDKSALPISAEIVIPRQTAQYYYDVKSALAGSANTFRIEVGPALVQYADSFLRPAFKDGNDIAIESLLRVSTCTISKRISMRSLPLPQTKI